MSASLIGRLGSSAFRLSTTLAVDVARGLVLLYGIGTSALPSWDPRMAWSNLMGGLAGSGSAGPSGHANSPHPSSREGHHSTAGWSSSFLLLRLVLGSSHAATASLVQRKSVPSTQVARDPRYPASVATIAPAASRSCTDRE